MKKAVIALLLFIVTITINAQIILDPNAKKVGSIDGVVNTLYKVISEEKGTERDWAEFKLLFYPGAKLIPTGKSLDGNHLAKFMSVDDYISTSGEWLKEHGFIEKEIYRKIDVFGNIAQVFSTYEAYHSEDDEFPIMRGINSIQLLNDGLRWWIINIYWMQETPVSPIPRDYLPKG